MNEELKAVRLWASGDHEDETFEEGFDHDPDGEHYVYDEAWPTLLRLASEKVIPPPVHLHRVRMGWYDDGCCIYDPNHEWTEDGPFLEREEVDAWVASLPQE